MRKRICNKVLLKFISVGAFLGGGGGKRIGKLPFSHAFFLGGEGDGEVFCLACFFGGGRGWGSCLSRILFLGGGVGGLGKVPV